MPTTFMDVLDVIIRNAFGGDWTLFALVSLAIIVFFAFKWRIPSIIALGFAWCLVYAFYVISPSSIIQMILAVVSLGVAVSIISSILKYGAKSQE